MKNRSIKGLSCFLVFAILISSVLSLPTYAISTSCVESHFSNLHQTQNHMGEIIIRTPPSENTCPYVAMSLLLTFYDSYWNDGFVENDYEWEYGTYNSADDTLVETFAPTEEAEDWENYIDNNVPAGEDTDPYYRIYAIDHYSFFLEPYLVSLGVSLGLHPDPDEPLGLNNTETVQVLSYYLYNVCGFSTSQIEVKYLHENNGDINTIMREQISRGFPVIYIGKELVNGEQLGHELIAYGIDETNDVLLHTGWSGNEYQKLSNTQYNLNRAIIWLEINEENLPHQCTDAYRDYSDETKTYCACQIYSKHPSHDSNHISISGNSDYDEAYHWTNGCHCGKPGPDSIVTPHDLSYVITPGSTTHYAECDECGYNDYVDHNYNQLTSVSDTHHAESCGCGAVVSTQEAHVASRCVSNGTSSHSIYCKCGYLISRDLHEMIIIDIRYSKCMHCGYVRDNSVPGQIIMGVEDEAETSEE